MKNPGESGAAGLTIILLVVSLLGAVGLSADVGNAVYQRSKLQNSADTAVLAIGRDCALAKAGCNDAGAESTATHFTNENAGGGNATVPGGANPAAGTAQVQVARSIPMMFAGLIGADDKGITVTARAEWGGHPTEGAPVLPFGVPLCFLMKHPAPETTPVVLRSDVASALFHAAKNSSINQAVSKLAPVTDPDCTSPSSGPVRMLTGMVWLSDSNDAEGTFNWNSSNCNMKVKSIDAIIATENSAGIPAQCMSKFGSKIKAGMVLMAPIYAPSEHHDEFGLDRAPDGRVDKPALKIEIIGFAPFKVTGWNMKSNSGGHLAACSEINMPGPHDVGCEGISGYFVESVSKDPDFEYAPEGSDFGASYVRLSE